MAIVAHPIIRVRRAPHVTNELKRLFYGSFELDMEVGLGTTNDPTVAPTMRLRWSDDGGHIWSHYYTMSAGVSGAYGTRVFRNQLGSGRDRVFEVSTCDVAAWRLMDAYLELERGVH